MERIVNPTSDFFVRYLLGSEENKDILLDFINTILNDSGFNPAVNLEIMNPFNLITFSDSKESILGVKAEEEKMKILIKNDPVMEHAHKSYEKFAADDELLQVYEAREKRLHDEATRLSDAKEEGLLEGIEKGIQKGIQKGSLEKAKDAAIVLKKANVSIDIICKSTGLTEEEIEKL